MPFFRVIHFGRARVTKITLVEADSAKNAEYIQSIDSVRDITEGLEFDLYRFEIDSVREISQEEAGILHSPKAVRDQFLEELRANIGRAAAKRFYVEYCAEEDV